MNNFLPKNITGIYYRKLLPEPLTRKCNTKSLPEITDNSSECVVYSQKRKVIRIFLVMVLLMQIHIDKMQAQWSTDPTHNLIIGYGLNPQVCSDSTGGCYITYEQNTTYPRRLVLERLNKYGYKPWGTYKRIVGELPEQWFAKIVDDGDKGALICFSDHEVTGSPHNPIIRSILRVQRVDSNGIFLWGSNGVRVSLSETYQFNQAIVNDRNGGCVIIWEDTLNQLKTQRIDSVGNRVWGDSGITVSTTLQEEALLSQLSSSDFVIEYYSTVDGYIMQKFNLLGQFLWGNGVSVSTGARIMRTGDSGKTYLFGGQYLGYRNGKGLFTLNLQVVDSTGTHLWDSLGIVLDTLNTNSVIKTVMSVQKDVISVGWRKEYDSLNDIHAQMVKTDGTTILPFRGIPISSIQSSKYLDDVINDGDSFFTFVWFDIRAQSGTYAQKIDTLGRLQWDTSDIAISIPHLVNTKVVTDGQRGMIVIGSKGSFSVCAQQVSSKGKLGEVITSLNENATREIPQRLMLHQNYPNPFNPSTMIQFELPQSDFVRIEIYNLLGQRIHTLTEQFYYPGIHSIPFSGDHLTSGIYYYMMKTKEKIITRKFTILK